MSFHNQCSLLQNLSLVFVIQRTLFLNLPFNLCKNSKSLRNTVMFFSSVLCSLTPRSYALCGFKTGTCPPEPRIAKGRKLFWSHGNRIGYRCCYQPFFIYFHLFYNNNTKSKHVDAHNRLGLMNNSTFDLVILLQELVRILHYLLLTNRKTNS